MERAFLGITTFYLHQCGSQKFFTGKQGQNVVFLFSSKSGDIAAKAQQSPVIMAILGFPVIIVQLMLLMRLSNTAFAPLLTIPISTVLLLAAMDLLVVLLAIILFPFLWKD